MAVSTLFLCEMRSDPSAHQSISTASHHRILAKSDQEVAKIHSLADSHLTGFRAHMIEVSFDS